MAGNTDRLDQLEAALREYVQAELDNLDREVAFLEKVRKGRGVGKVKDQSEDLVAKKLSASLASYLGS